MVIVIITDSFGGPRQHSGIQEVRLHQTYPELLKVRLADHEVKVDYESFRRITHLPAIVEKYKEADLFIIQVGVVDLYPRPLNFKNTVSQTIPIKLLRKGIRLTRRFVVKYIYKKPWSTEAEVKSAIEEVCRNVRSKIIWVNVAPVNKYQNWETPGANVAIQKTNIILRESIKKYSNSVNLDMHEILLRMANFEEYLHPADSHLNVVGNELYAAEILKAILSQEAD